MMAVMSRLVWADTGLVPAPMDNADNELAFLVQQASLEEESTWSYLS
jgi:hypothetical protein